MCNFRKLIYKIIGENPADCVLSSWSAWTTCSGGFKSRTRTIITPASEGGAACGPLTETVSCGEAFKWIGSEPYCEVDETPLPNEQFFRTVYIGGEGNLANSDASSASTGARIYINGANRMEDIVVGMYCFTEVAQSGNSFNGKNLSYKIATVLGGSGVSDRYLSATISSGGVITFVGFKHLI